MPNGFIWRIVYLEAIRAETVLHLFQMKPDYFQVMLGLIEEEIGAAKYD